MSTRIYHGFEDLLENCDFEFQKSIETVVRKDENMANNRLFVWNFESNDLEEMVDIFQIYKNETANEASRCKLNSNILRKMNNMLREGYNPVECMLYASKTINNKLTNDKVVQDILAERIRDVYLKRESETADILQNIIDMWTWIPQLKVVISAIGLIGENEELLDSVSKNYGDDETLKDRAFHAFMQNKTLLNLERAMKIVMTLQDAESDQIMARRFVKEISGFGFEGIRYVEKYHENPAVSRIGRNTINKILRDNSNVITNEDDEIQRESLAKKSAKDDLAFKDFIKDCQEHFDDKAFFISRFSRPEIGKFLKEVLHNSDGLDSRSRNNAIISLAIIGKKGYSPASAIIKECYREDDYENYAPIVAETILDDKKASTKLVDLWCEKRDYDLYGLYSLLKSSNLKAYPESLGSVHNKLEQRFKTLLEEKSFIELENLTSNMQIFWDKKLFFLIPLSLIKFMEKILVEYCEGEYGDLTEEIIISMIETICHSWNATVESVLFKLYNNTSNKRIKQLSYKILQGREVQAPK